MNRRTALTAFAAAAAFAAAPAWAQTEINVLDGADRAAGIAQANRALNSFQRLQGRFTQTAPGGGRATGAIYLQRPGKLRFEYDPPNPLLIVSDGSVVAMRDPELRTTERTPLRSTPLALILGERIDLERQARVTRVSRAGPWLMVTMRDRGGQTDGEITIQFYGDEAELRSWDVRDATGARTRITLSDVSFPASLDRSLFRLEDMLERNRPGRR
ncbi:MAG: outer membrane lipoprotein carrier protein LolA [Hyphomonadaceae bacterium]